MRYRISACLGLALSTILCPAIAAAADPDPASDGSASSLTSFFDNWSSRVDEAQGSQPHWITPIATVTPRLEEEFRYDQYWEGLSHGSATDVYGAGKGIELIPWED